MLTQSKLFELVEYNKKTGIFTRKFSTLKFKLGSVIGNTKHPGYVQIYLLKNVT
jgi:hypothetical protein